MNAKNSPFRSLSMENESIGFVLGTNQVNFNEILSYYVVEINHTTSSFFFLRWPQLYQDSTGAPISTVWIIQKTAILKDC